MNTNNFLWYWIFQELGRVQTSPRAQTSKHTWLSLRLCPVHLQNMEFVFVSAIVFVFVSFWASDFVQCICKTWNLYLQLYLYLYLFEPLNMPQAFFYIYNCIYISVWASNFVRYIWRTLYLWKSYKCICLLLICLYLIYAIQLFFPYQSFGHLLKMQPCVDFK